MHPGSRLAGVNVELREVSDCGVHGLLGALGGRFAYGNQTTARFLQCEIACQHPSRQDVLQRDGMPSIHCCWYNLGNSEPAERIANLNVVLELREVL